LIGPAFALCLTALLLIVAVGSFALWITNRRR